jgi:hypothetical protein
MTSGFHREVADNCAVLSDYAANSSNFLPTFRDNLLVTSSGFKNLVSAPLDSYGWVIHEPYVVVTPLNISGR